MPPTIRSLADASFDGKRVLVRVDHNIDTNENGELKNDEKIRATLPTIQKLLAGGARVILMTHVGRPKGKPVPKYSTVTVAERLKSLLPGVSLTHVPQTVGPEVEKAVQALEKGSIVYLENVRFQPEEEGEPEQQAAFAKKLAALGDLFVNEAFASCHEYEEASTCAIARLLPSYAGMHLEKEVAMLSKVLHDPQRPMVLIISGAKMETKIPVIERFLDKGDDILLGGCIANTFVAAKGFGVGTSKYEMDSTDTARQMMLKSDKDGSAEIHVPSDAVLASAPTADTTANRSVENIEADMAMFDIGTATAERYADVISKAKTVVWNGPLGMYEVEAFAGASKRMAQAVADATSRGATTLLGGGDTIDFHVKYGLPLDAYTFVSTGGGAMLEFIGGKTLPPIEALRG